MDAWNTQGIPVKNVMINMRKMVMEDVTSRIVMIGLMENAWYVRMDSEKKGKNVWN